MRILLVLNYLLGRVARCLVAQLKMTGYWTCYWSSFGREVKVAQICWLHNLDDWLLDMLLVLLWQRD